MNSEGFCDRIRDESIYHIIHSDIHNILLEEFQSYILEKGEHWDMGSTILARMEGMPILESVE